MGQKHRKPSQVRNTALLGITSGVVNEINVTYDSGTGGFEIAEVDPASLKTEVYYERASGKDKVTLSIPAKSELPAFDPWRQLKGQVTYLLAIDTNTKTVNDRRISVTFASIIPGNLNSQGQSGFFLPLCAYAIFDALPNVNPERIGWHLVLQNHLRPETANERIGIVVDSELGLLPKINNRNVGYYGEHFLPPIALMIYGSSDADSNTIPGQMIRYCDKMSEHMFKHLMPKLDQLPQLNEGDANYLGHLLIKFKRESETCKA